MVRRQGRIRQRKPKRVRLGGVAYAPSVVTIFSNLTKYLNNKGFASNFVLYSDHEELVAALGKGDIDIAWMSPVTHGKYHIRHGSCPILNWKLGQTQSGGSDISRGWAQKLRQARVTATR
jgi:hypothetical protein